MHPRGRWIRDRGRKVVSSRPIGGGVLSAASRRISVSGPAIVGGPGVTREASPLAFAISISSVGSLPWRRFREVHGDRS
jgi:hypothetical protein